MFDETGWYLMKPSSAGELVPKEALVEDMGGWYT
jgi:hypothetical protein